MTGTDEWALRSQADQARREQDWARLTQLLGRLAELEPDLGRRNQLRMERGAVLSEQLGDVDEAYSAYVEVIGDDPGHAEALEAMEQICVATGRWAQLTNLLEHRLDQTESQAARVELHLRLALLFEDVLGDEHAAREQYEKAARIAPSRQDIRESLARLGED